MNIANLSRPGEVPADGDMVRITHANGATDEKCYYAPPADPGARYHVHTPIDFLDALPDAVELEFWGIYNGTGADAITATQWLERAKLRGQVDFNEPKNRAGLSWLVARTALTNAEAEALAGGAL